MRDIIIDAETLDTKDTAVIPSIGARLCNLETGEMGEGFHVKLNVQEQIDAGYTVSADTIGFWMNQNMTARDYLIQILQNKTPTVSRQVGFSMLHQFISSVKNAHAWGNGISFDLGLCIREWGQDNLPWEFWNEQDVRTIVSFGRRVFDVQFKKEVQFEGVQHNPLDDATHEAQYLMEYFRHGRELSNKSVVLTHKLFTAETELQQARETMARPAPTLDTASLEAIAKEQREVSELRQALDKAHARILELESPIALNPLDELTALDQEVIADNLAADDGVKLEGMTEDPAPAKGEMESMIVLVHGGNERLFKLLWDQHHIHGYSTISDLPVSVNQVEAVVYSHLNGITDDKRIMAERRGIPVVCMWGPDFLGSTDPEYGTTLRRRIKEANSTATKGDDEVKTPVKKPAKKVSKK